MNNLRQTHHVSCQECETMISELEVRCDKYQVAIEKMIQLAITYTYIEGQEIPANQVNRINGTIQRIGQDALRPDGQGK